MNCQPYRLIYCAIAICFLLSFAQWDSVVAQARDASNYDLSTEQGVTAARESLTGKKLAPADQSCIRRPRELPIIVVGTWSLRFGCGFAGVFVKSQYLGHQDEALSKAALAAVGWNTANRTQREELARTWVTKGLLAFSTVLSEENGDFKDRSFQAPQAVSKENDEVVVTLWAQLRMRGRGVLTTTYFLREYRFARDGDFAGDVQLDRFTAPKK
jgi:hypothetical protein